MTAVEAWCWACPACRTPLMQQSATQLVCPADGAIYSLVDGIWRFLTPQQESYYARFVRQYDRVRSGEQWGSDQAAYYQALPYRDLSERHKDIWRIRAVSYRSLLKKVLRPLAARCAEPLRIVDAGAGNGWMASRLAQEGHRVLATDLRTNQADGLGAYVWYEDRPPFTPAQAAFESIPLATGAADSVIFAGAFHYATDYAAVLQEAKRVLDPGGAIVIVESPVYRRAGSGKRMVQELHGRLREEHGIQADALPHENYLTLDRVHELGRQLNLQWQIVKPYYGLGWTLAPWLAKLKRQREPARFYILVASVRE